MKKAEFIKEIARANKVDAAGAADQVDRAVSRILRTLRAGKPARLPGVGTITPGREWGFEPDRDHD